MRYFKILCFVFLVLETTGIKCQPISSAGISTSINYAILKKKLDAGYFNSIAVSNTNNLYFKFEEEYFDAANSNLNYKLYSDAGALVTTNTLPENIGDNRFAINVNGFAPGYYKLCVFNRKNEMWQSRVKIN